MALFTVEFFADKIPAFDLVWNALHTFIRVPVAALLAYEATASLSPGEQLAATLAGGAIAFVAHGGTRQYGPRSLPSPEPFSNIGLSGSEDVTPVISLTWLASVHPYWAGGDRRHARNHHNRAGALGVARAEGALPGRGAGCDAIALSRRVIYFALRF